MVDQQGRTDLNGLYAIGEVVIPGCWRQPPGIEIAAGVPGVRLVCGRRHQSAPAALRGSRAARLGESRVMIR